jgi:predicted nucleotide-binding protein
MRKVLFIDDDVYAMRSYVMALERSSFGVVAVGSVDAALKEAQGTHFDVIVVDLMMPSGSLDMLSTGAGLETGIEITRKLKEISPGTKIVCLTNAFNPEAEAWFARLGDGYYRKQANPPIAFARQLDLLVVADRSSPTTTKSFKIEQRKVRVFLIHGHDKVVLAKVESLLLRLGCEPVIFSKLAGKGAKTNIEILEQELISVDAVVALLTPDDEGRKRGSGGLEPRARQNVMIEAGYALISRRDTAWIVATGGVCIPSDLDGINRIQTEVWNRGAAINLARDLIHRFNLQVNIEDI